MLTEMNIINNVKKLLKRRIELHREIVSIDNLLRPLGESPLGNTRPIKHLKQVRATRRKISAAAKAKMAAAARERWRKAKAAGKTTL